jgi:hypothetical protein
MEVLNEGRTSLGPIEARPNIQPLCDEHDSGTDLRELDIPEARGFYVYVCRDPACGRVYSRNWGYHHLQGEKNTRVLRCPHDEQALFRKEIQSDGKALWECPRVNCGRQVRI